jgi:hypothetical protein
MALLFGKPDSILLLEDLALRFSLDDLQEMFYMTLEEVNARIFEDNATPRPDNQRILKNIREIVKETQKFTLYG